MRHASCVTASWLLMPLAIAVGIAWGGPAQIDTSRTTRLVGSLDDVNADPKADPKCNGNSRYSKKCPYFTDIFGDRISCGWNYLNIKPVAQGVPRTQLLDWETPRCDDYDDTEFECGEHWSWVDLQAKCEVNTTVDPTKPTPTPTPN